MNEQDISIICTQMANDASVVNDDASKINNLLKELDEITESITTHWQDKGQNPKINECLKVLSSLRETIKIAAEEVEKLSIEVLKEDAEIANEDGGTV